MVNWENSYKYGESKEVALLPILQDYFGKGVSRSSEGRFAKYDYTDEKSNYELKSRTNKMRQYSTIFCNDDNAKQNGRERC